MLIDGGATHNFIDRTLVERRGLPTEEFEGFTVAVAGGGRMECTRWIPKLNITLGNYSLTNDFLVVDVSDTNVVLGVQWLYSIGKYSTDYRTMEMEFQGPDGKRVVLRGMNTYPAKVVSSQRMEAVLRLQEMEWAAESFITSQDPTDLKQQYPVDIQAILHKHDMVFGGIPPGRSPDRGFEHIIELE